MDESSLLTGYINADTIQEIEQTLSKPYKGVDLRPFLMRRYPDLRPALQARDIHRVEAFVLDLQQEFGKGPSKDAEVINNTTQLCDVLHMAAKKDARPWLDQNAIRWVGEEFRKKPEDREKILFIAKHMPFISNAITRADVLAMKRIIKSLEISHMECNNRDDLFKLLKKWAAMKMKLGIDSPIQMPIFDLICRVRGVMATAVIDTGCSTTVIQTAFAHRLNIPEYQFDASKAAVAQGVGTVQMPTKLFGLTLEIRSRMLEIDAYVAPVAGVKYDLIIGMDFLAWNDCQVYCKDYSIYFAEKKFWVYCMPSRQRWENSRWKDFGQNDDRAEIYQ